MRIARIVAALLTLGAARGAAASGTGGPECVLHFSPAPGMRVRIVALPDVAVPGILRMSDRAGAIEDPAATVVYKDDHLLTVRSPRIPGDLTVVFADHTLNADLVSIDDEWLTVTAGSGEEPRRILRSTLKRLRVRLDRHWITVPPPLSRAVPGDRIHVARSVDGAALGPGSKRVHIQGRLVELTPTTLTIQPDGSDAQTEIVPRDSAEVDLECDGVWFRAEPRRPPDARGPVAVVAMRKGTAVEIAAQPFVEVPGWVSLSPRHYELKSERTFKQVRVNAATITLARAKEPPTRTCPRPGHSVHGAFIAVTERFWHLGRNGKRIFVPRVPGLDVFAKTDGAWLPVADSVRVDP
jgi:hypothetical protein